MIVEGKQTNSTRLKSEGIGSILTLFWEDQSFWCGIMYSDAQQIYVISFESRRMEWAQLKKTEICWKRQSTWICSKKGWSCRKEDRKRNLDDAANYFSVKLAENQSRHLFEMKCKWGIYPHCMHYVFCFMSTLTCSPPPHLHTKKKTTQNLNFWEWCIFVDWQPLILLITAKLRFLSNLSFHICFCFSWGHQKRRDPWSRI